ncbi:sulfite exporter TauE/SafE family protein [Coriobacteriia bacterium Es71-Z0120]|uniref:cytochrome c biogenesis CcdA family protein n=1 Tax=Parvivirga hydrogeniphila TaxID=2939460 RepID=UPI0022608ACD|nr:cytochrome c biogenesis protein CcdA [Parvivirga hydrogeniphila]MCL4078121.1 sulfite exporter TauE/SafE family protein [Parvivirga hydrogeniphila]
MEALADKLLAGVVAGPAAFAVAFVGGLVAGFGPCILPMVPAVFGYITGTVASGERDARPAAGRALVLVAAFVFGMSMVFASIGVVAGALGRAIVIGQWAYFAAAAVCLVLGLHMLGIVQLPVDRLNALLPVRRPERRGLAGSFLFGMLFGLVASPCATPILAAIATIAAAGRDAVRGGALLFVYGLGKGVPLVLLGVASGSMAVMKRLGRGADTLAKVGGAGLLFAAAYLVYIS